MTLGNWVIFVPSCKVNRGQLPCTYSHAGDSSIRTFRTWAPRDCVEFSSELLVQLARSEASGGNDTAFCSNVTQEEFGGETQPLILDSICECGAEKPGLNDMIPLWTNAHGMYAGFVTPKGPKCIFVDRLLTPTPMLGCFQEISLDDLIQGAAFCEQTLWQAQHFVSLQVQIS